MNYWNQQNPVSLKLCWQGWYSTKRKQNKDFFFFKQEKLHIWLIVALDYSIKYRGSAL